MSSLKPRDPDSLSIYVNGVLCEGFADDIEIRLERGTNEAVSNNTLSVSGNIEVDEALANQVSLWLTLTNEEKK